MAGRGVVAQDRDCLSFDGPAPAAEPRERAVPQAPASALSVSQEPHAAVKERASRGRPDDCATALSDRPTRFTAEGPDVARPDRQAVAVLGSIGPKSGIDFWDPSDAHPLRAAHRSKRKAGSTFPHDAHPLRAAHRSARKTGSTFPHDARIGPKSGPHFWDPSDAPLFGQAAHRSARKTGSTFPHDARIGPKSGPHFWDPSDAPLFESSASFCAENRVHFSARCASGKPLRRVQPA